MFLFTSYINTNNTFLQMNSGEPDNDELPPPVS
jgi:hypothetical protein